MSEATHKFRVLLVGCGNIAGGFDTDAAPGVPPRTHAGAYLAHGGFNLAACVEPDSGKREAFARRWGIAQAHADIDAALAADGTYDVISICSPTAAHHEDGIAALALRPRLLFCEKPLCAGLGQAEDLVRSCTAQGVLLAVNHNRRWDTEVLRLRDELASGHWGMLRSVSGHYNKGVLNNGSHMIDLLHDLLGPLEPQCVGSPLYDHWPDDPTVPALLRARRRRGQPQRRPRGRLFAFRAAVRDRTRGNRDGGRWHALAPAPSGAESGVRGLPRSARGRDRSRRLSRDNVKCGRQPA